MNDSYITQGNIKVIRTIEALEYNSALDIALERIDRHKGAVFASGYEYPGRYSRWDISFLEPPVQIINHGRQFGIAALNERGQKLISMLAGPLFDHSHVEDIEISGTEIHGVIAPMDASFPEEERSKQPSFFSVVRAIIALFGSAADPHLGFYGAFGYDLAF